MSSKLGFATLVAMVGLFLASDFSYGQQGRGQGFMRGRTGIMVLVTNEAVQKELGIGDQEKEKIAAASQAFFDEVREQAQSASGGVNFQDATAEERQKMMAKFQELNQKLTAKHLPAIKEALKPEQFTRLQQISWQVGGSMAFGDPELIKALDVSKEQQEKIVALNQEYQQKQFGLFGGGAGGNFQEAFAKSQELGKERDKKAVEILSKEQQEKYATLKGKPFDLPPPQIPGRRGGDKKD